MYFPFCCCSLGVARSPGHGQLWLRVLDQQHGEEAHGLLWGVAHGREGPQDPAPAPAPPSQEGPGCHRDEEWSLSQENHLLVWWLPPGSLWAAPADRVREEIGEDGGGLVRARRGRAHSEVKHLQFSAPFLCHITQEHFWVSWDCFSLIEQQTVHYWLCKTPISAAIPELFHRQEGK